LVEGFLIFFNELVPYVKNTSVQNVWLCILMRFGRLEDALKVFDEMYVK
jgi:pentatricopeptide repeat protein